jgi:hypothetical protein
MAPSVKLLSVDIWEAGSLWEGRRSHAGHGRIACAALREATDHGIVKASYTSPLDVIPFQCYYEYVEIWGECPAARRAQRSPGERRGFGQWPAMLQCTIGLLISTKKQARAHLSRERCGSKTLKYFIESRKLGVCRATRWADNKGDQGGRRVGHCFFL